MSQTILDFFEKNGPCLNVRGIEICAGLPPKTLDHFLKGRRNLNNHAAKKIEGVLISLAFSATKDLKQ